MNILFIITESTKVFDRAKPLSTQEDIHLGLSYISSLLEQNGHKTDILVLPHNAQMYILDKKISDFNPAIILFSIVYKEFYSVIKIVKHIRNKYKNTIFLGAGGAHVTLNASEVLHHGFDAVCIGEGEYPTLELVQQLEQGQRPTKIKNMWFNTPEGIEKNEVRAYIEDLDALPFPNRKMWQPFIKNTDSIHDIIIGRGCPYNCTYCCNHALRKMGTGRYVRFRKPEYIIKEIQDLIATFPTIKTIFLEAEAINLNMPFLEELSIRLKELNDTLPVPLVFGANIRLHANIDMQRIMDLFVTANIVITNIGIESGNEQIRKEVLKRGEYSNDDIQNAVRIAKKAHRHLMLFVLLGIPGETVENCRETVMLIKECHPHFIHLGIFTPYPGTELYNSCLSNGLIDPYSYREKGRNRATFDTQFMSKKQIQKEYYRFFPSVYAKNKQQFIFLRLASFLILRYHMYFLTPLVKKLLK